MQAKAMNILWVKSGPLFPLDSGGKKRTHAMLEEISRQHHVTYLALLAEGQALHPDEGDATYAAEKVWLPWRETCKRSWRFPFDLLRNFLFSPFPYALEKYISKPMMRWLESHLATDRFDLVVCDFLFPAPNFRHLKTGVPLILFQHNMEALIWKRLAESSCNPIKRFYLHGQFRRFARWEEKLSRLFDGVVTVSADDTAYARRVYHLGNVRGHVATGVDLESFLPLKDSAETQGIVGFLGSMDWLANIQGVEFFVREALPIIKSLIPEMRFKIIGRNPPDHVRRLSDTDGSIEVTGSVDDVCPHLKACDLMVVPLLSGGGTRIKILEAMAMGVPVVSTTIGAEGLEMTAGEHLLIADTPRDFADATIRLLESPGERTRLAANAARKVREEHTWQHATGQLLDLCNASPSHN
jgi:glycosyltransferase involved in cell wall biosynthesis